MAQQHVVFGVPRFQHVPVAPNRRFVADHHDLFAGIFRHFLQGEVLHAMRDRLVAFAPARLPQVAYQLPVAVLPQRAFAEADTLAAKFVARFDEAFVRLQLQRFLAAQSTYRIQRFEDLPRRFARAFQRRRVDGGYGVQLRADRDVMRGGLRHAHAHVGQVETGQPLVQQVPGVLHFAVAHEMDGCRRHIGRLSCVSDLPATCWLSTFRRSPAL